MKQHLRSLILVLILVLVSLTVLPAEIASAETTARGNYLPEVKVFTYPNGLTLLVVERSDAPTVACYRLHKVGSVNEYPGMTGVAHLLEHMMSKGTKTLGTWNYEAEKPIMEEIEQIMDRIDIERAKGVTAYSEPDMKKITELRGKLKELQDAQRRYIRKDEFDSLISTHGGYRLNASTYFDKTDYYVSMPSNKLEIWAFLDSTLLKDPVWREFYSERDVVHEERRMYMNIPNDALFETFVTTMFTTLPYGHEIVGFDCDIESMRKDDVAQFFKIYYAPGNTILALVGDVKADEAYKLVGKYFGDIPSQKPPRAFTHIEPPQKGERRAELEFEAEQEIYIGFHGPKPGHPDQYALEVLASILGEGRTSRFHENLVQTKVAYSAASNLWTMAYANAFVIEAVPRDSVTTRQLEDSIYRELDRFKTEPVSRWELEKVSNQIDTQFISILENPMTLARTLANSHAWTGNWRSFDTREKIKKVTPEDIMRVANKYLTKSNRTVVTLVPPPDK